jgi:Immunity protein 53
MDALQRLQNWYTMHCDGDWEHDYGIRIDTLDNPGWALKINLAGTNLEKAVLPHAQTERTSTDWTAWKIDKGYFEAFGGPHNLTELILYFLDVLLPQQGDQTYEYKVHIPLVDYPGLIWRVADAVVVKEGQLRLTRFPKPHQSDSYLISGEDTYAAFEQLMAGAPADAPTKAQVGDIIAVAVEEHQFSTARVYAGHATV